MNAKSSFYSSYKRDLHSKRLSPVLFCLGLVLNRFPLSLSQLSPQYQAAVLQSASLGKQLTVMRDDST